jgi:hypothetical protein
VTHTNEEFDAIEVGYGVGSGTIEDVRIEDVRFDHWSAANGSRRGDCVRLVGKTPSSSIKHVVVSGGVFKCASSAITVERDVFDTTIQGNEFLQSARQDIESEAIGAISIINNLFHKDGNLEQADFAITVDGAGKPMARVIASGNVFNGRGVKFYGVRDVTLTGSTFASIMESDDAVIDFGNISRELPL